jgi:hypothetical protein
MLRDIRNRIESLMAQCGGLNVLKHSSRQRPRGSVPIYACRRQVWPPHSDVRNIILNQIYARGIEICHLQFIPVIQVRFLISIGLRQVLSLLERQGIMSFQYGSHHPRCG